MRELPRNQILVGDALDRLRQLPTASVDTAVTSPPYYLLRNYHVAGQFGLEPTVTAWVENLRTVLNEVGRVLKPTGSLWLDLGDSYSRHDRYGAPPKALLLAPERLLLALVADGWIVRNKVIWAKANPMPNSVAVSGTQRSSRLMLTENRVCN
jgi:DNA modification methylase